MYLKSPFLRKNFRFSTLYLILYLIQYLSKTEKKQKIFFWPKTAAKVPKALKKLTFIRPVGRWFLAPLIQRLTGQPRILHNPLHRSHQILNIRIQHNTPLEQIKQLQQIAHNQANLARVQSNVVLQENILLLKVITLHLRLKKK